MKQFNLEEYLKNPSRKVVTRDGRNARIICTDAKGDFPIIALIETTNGSIEFVYKFKKNGRFLDNDSDYHYDLFFAPEKKEGWVNIYRDPHANITYTEDYIFKTEKEAKENACDKKYIATAKIEWEE